MIISNEDVPKRKGRIKIKEDSLKVFIIEPNKRKMTIIKPKIIQESSVIEVLPSKRTIKNLQKEPNTLTNLQKKIINTNKRITPNQQIIIPQNSFQPFPMLQPPQQQQQTNVINPVDLTVPERVPVPLSQDVVYTQIPETFIDQNINPSEITIRPNELLSDFSNLQYQIFRLNKYITFLRNYNNDTIRILANNLTANYQQILKTTDIKIFQNIFLNILREINSILKILKPNTEFNLDATINFIKNNNQFQLQSGIKGIIDDIINKLNDSLNVYGKTRSDFLYPDFYSLFHSYNLDKLPLIKSFLYSEIENLPDDQKNQLLRIQNNRRQINTNDSDQQISIINFFINKYGLNFPPLLNNDFIITINNNLRLFENNIKRYLQTNKWDSATKYKARQYFNIVSEEEPPIPTYYEGDILNYDQQTTAGVGIRSLQNISRKAVEPIKNLSYSALTYAKNNPTAALGNVISGVGAATLGANYFNRSAPDTTLSGSVVRDYADYAVKDQLSGNIADNIVSALPGSNNYKGIFKLPIKYVADKGIRTIQTISDTVQDGMDSTAIYLRDSAGNILRGFRDASGIVRDMAGNAISYINPLGEEPIIDNNMPRIDTIIDGDNIYYNARTGNEEEEIFDELDMRYVPPNINQ